MSKLLIIFMLFKLIAQIICENDCQEEGLTKLDENMAKLLTIGEHSGRKFPNRTGLPLQEWCGQTQSYINEIEKYKSKCLGDLSKQVAGIIVNSIKHTVLRRYCKKDKIKMTALVEAAPCLNSNDIIITRCYNNLINSIMGAKNAQDKLKLPYLCCAYHKIFDCFHDNLTEAPGCNEKHVEIMSQVIKSVTSKSMELICGDYTEDSDRCDKLGPPPLKKDNERQWKSLAPPILELLSSFPPVLNTKNNIFED